MRSTLKKRMTSIYKKKKKMMITSKQEWFKTKFKIAVRTGLFIWVLDLMVIKRMLWLLCQTNQTSEKEVLE